jgi:uncharacterized protein (DUF2147 family)
MTSLPSRRRADAFRAARALARTSAALALGGLALLAAAPGSSSPRAAADIAGRWATAGFGSIVELRPCAAQPAALCGRIVWLWQPNDAQGKPRLDRHNPDRGARTRPLLGLEILRGLREREPGVWSDGAVYNPDDGRTYAGELRMRSGALELRGCALRVFCETQTWRRPEEVLAATREIAR